MPNIAERLTELREKNHLSQTDVAKRLNVTPALISAYEKHERKPSLDKLVALADIYHTSTDYILGRTNKSNDSVLLDITHLTSRQINILRSIIEDMEEK